MKTASPALVALLLTRRFQRTDLWTLTLSGGTVVRWTSADRQMSWSGNQFLQGPLLKRTSITDEIGLTVSTLQLTITAREGDAINGVPLLEFIRRRGLDGANIKLERAFFPEWGDPVTGTIIRFAGRITSVGGIEGDSCTVQISSWTILLNTNIPPNVNQSGCMHVVYDTGCGLSEAAFRYALSVTGVTSRTVITVNAGQAAFAQGRIVFTSGPCAGISRTVKSVAGNVLTLLSPLPATPGVGDTLNASYGCPLDHPTCGNRFNNLGRFKGTPFVPTPETAV